MRSDWQWPTLKFFIDKVHEETYTIVPRPRVVIGVPLEITEVERKAVEDAALSAGARQVFLVEEPLLSAIGGKLPIAESHGNMIVDVGGGTTKIAVISLAGVVNWKTLGIAGDELTKNIIQYARDAFEGEIFFKALWLSVRRILRCHPFSAGGYDPVSHPLKKES